MQLRTGQVFRNKDQRRKGRLVRIESFQGGFAVVSVLTDNDGKPVKEEEMITVKRDSLAEGKLWEYERQADGTYHSRVSTIEGLDDWLAAHPVREFARERGYSNTELAVACGVSLPGLKRWYAGSLPKTATVGTLAELMGLSPEAIIENIKNWKAERPSV